MADYVGIIHHGHMLYQGRLDALEKEGQTLEDAFLQLTEGGNSL